MRRHGGNHSDTLLIGALALALAWVIAHSAAVDAAIMALMGPR